LHTLPTGFLNVKVDGRSSYFEWISAGQYVAGSERGTMAQVTDSLIRRIHIGFDERRLFLRIDTDQRASSDLTNINDLRIRFAQPKDLELSITGFSAEDTLTVSLFKDGEKLTAHGCEAAVGQVFELAASLTALGVQSGDTVQFFVEAFGNGQSIDRAPRETTIDLIVPPADFEQIMWQV
jgi:hypothetical protein